MFQQVALLPALLSMAALPALSCVLPPFLTSHDGTAVAQRTSTATVDTGRTTAAVVTQTVWVTTQSPVGLTNHPGAAATTNPDTHVGLNPKPTATSMEATAASAVNQMTGSSGRSQTLSQTTSRPPESQTQQQSSQLDEANSETGKNSTAPLPEHAESSSSLTASQTTGPQPNSTADIIFTDTTATIHLFIVDVGAMPINGNDGNRSSSLFEPSLIVAQPGDTVWGARPMPRAPAEPEPCDSEWDRLILSGAGYFVGAGLVFGKLE
ncbi:Mucin-12 [Aspergillus tubingensis]|nr:Mucin-12 [Aspergillus tubingensis]